MEQTFRDTLTNHPLFQALAPYRALKERPLGFVDVGARGGVHPLVNPLAEVTGILGFEPDKGECGRLREIHATASPWAICEFEPVALADQPGRSRLHLLSAATNHSLRPPNQDLIKRYDMIKFEKVGSIEVETTTLDDVLFSRRKTESFWGEFLKLDTQGTEMEVLLGAKRTLTERTAAILTEVEFCQIYQGQRLFSDIELFLRDCGFSFYGFTDMFYRSCKQLNKYTERGRERILYADAVFFKEPQLLAMPMCPMELRQAYVLFVTAVLLGYFDFALEIALKTWARNEEGQRVRELIHYLAAIPEGQSLAEIKSLADLVHARPRHANVLRGQFIDRNRLVGDYGDVVLG
ncbi:FkbM family methyltransferase [Nitrospira sp. T9]|uniref:FkbM family methyltransferase n=1 Tax=unclassified Nitrospira TaxID=2652172 RepID=UPI003F976F81